MERPLAVLGAFLLACGGSTATRPAGDPPIVAHSALADDDGFTPSYGKAELEEALIAERGVEATAERRVGELEAKGEQLTAARADLEVRRRFIASLEGCQATGRTCPPRLDDPPWSFDIDAKDAKPPLDAPLRFDLADWQKVAAELHGRACACRTVECIDGVGAAIDQLETRPMQDVRGDETASASITRARECLFRLRGKAIGKPIAKEEP